MGNARQTEIKMNGYRQPKSRFKTCLWWVGLLPTGFVFGLVGYVYFILMSQVIVPLLQGSPLLGVLEFAVGHVVAGLLMVSYVRTIASEPGYVPVEFYLEHENVSEANRMVIKMCSKCQRPKPPRTHHCRACGRCILKMDHHCPWVNNCVAFRNYKFFVLFVTYLPVACFTVIVLCIPYLISIDYTKTFDMWKIQVFAVVAVCALFGLSLSGFAGVHYSLIWRNETTIENFDRERSEAKARLDRRRGRETRSGPYHNQFDLHSGRKNFEQVFGTNPWLWFLPVRSTPGDGTDFPIVPPDFERNAIFSNDDDGGADDHTNATSMERSDGSGRGWGRERISDSGDHDGSTSEEEEEWRQRQRR